MSRYHVLLYHGVHADDLHVGLRNSSGKHVPRARFAAEVASLARSGRVVSMEDIAAAHRGERDLPDEAVAVTFDDGFRNNYTDAWPVLEEHGVPATIYLATGFISSDRMIWTDRLEAAFIDATRPRMDLHLDGNEVRADLDDPDARVTAFARVKAHCKQVPDDEKEAIVDRVTEQLRPRVPVGHPLYAFLTWDEVREMDASPLITFGAHTVDHVSLTRVDPATMRTQIDHSIEHVTETLGRPCRAFSYPEGQEGDVDENVIDHLRSRGIDHAPMAVDGVNDLRSTDPYRIARTMVGFEGRPFPLTDVVGTS